LQGLASCLCIFPGTDKNWLVTIKGQQLGTYVVQPDSLVDLGVGGDLALEVDVVPFRNVLGVQAWTKAQGNGGSIWKKQIN
jgi:hypothetical protein